MYQRHELLSTLSEEDSTATLKACGLPEKDEYTEDEADRFKECRSLITEGKTYKQATTHFRQQDKSRQTTEETEQPTKDQLLDISELLALAAKQCGTRISAREVVQILDICGLPDQEQYTSLEGDRFLEACQLIKTKNKSYEEVAAHFGVTSLADDNTALIEQINSFLNQASNTQAEQIRAMLPKLAVEQLQEIKAMFWQMTAQRLRQHVESGELEAEIKNASSNVLASSGNSFRLLNQSQTSSRSLKSLTGSSTNASTNE